MRSPSNGLSIAAAHKVDRPARVRADPTVPGRGGPILTIPDRYIRFAELGNRCSKMTLGLDFSSILIAARAGSEWAWTRLYYDLAPDLLRYFRCYSVESAEDLVGQVLLQVVRDLARFKGGEDRFRAWVFTIARRRLVDEWRRQGRRKEQASSDLLSVVSAASEEIETDALRRLGEQRVHSILARLTPAQRDVLFLRMVAGLTIEETAEVLGNTSGAVKSLQSRGLEAIRRLLPKEAVS